MTLNLGDISPLETRKAPHEIFFVNEVCFLLTNSVTADGNRILSLLQSVQLKKQDSVKEELIVHRYYPKT